MPCCVVHYRAGLLCVLTLGVLSGCLNRRLEPGFDKPDPAARLMAIRAAATANDRNSLQKLIESLDSDDPAERLLAIHALEGRTGMTFGYDHSASRAARQTAVEKWVHWFDETAPPHIPTVGDKVTL